MASLSLRPSRSNDGACVHVPILSGRVPQQPCQRWGLTCPELSPSVALPFLPPECPCPPVPTPGCHPDPSPPLSGVPTVLVFSSFALTTVVSHRATVPGPVGAPASGRVPPCLCPLSFPSTESVLVLPAQSSSVLPGNRIQIPQQGGQALPDSSPGSPLAPSQPHPTAPCASCHSLTQAPQLAPASPSVSTQWTPMQPPKCTSSRKSSPPSPASVRGLCTLGLPVLGPAPHSLLGLSVRSHGQREGASISVETEPKAGSVLRGQEGWPAEWMTRSLTGWAIWRQENGPIVPIPLSFLKSFCSDLSRCNFYRVKPPVP